MTTADVIDVLKRIDEVECDLRHCEVRLTSVRDKILRTNDMGRLLNSNGEMKAEPAEVPAETPAPWQSWMRDAADTVVRRMSNCGWMPASKPPESLAEELTKIIAERHHFWAKSNPSTKP
jgi:hypothetical protein